MSTVVLEIRSLDDALTGVAKAARGGKGAGVARISFASVELLWKVLTANRWGVLRAMVGRGPMTIRDIAGLVGRDVKAVHTDVKVLTRAGVLDRTEEGRAVFPYQHLQVRFDLSAVA